MLYSDLVPYTSYRFLEKCKQKSNGFINTTIHRIVLGGWIQCGGFEMTHHRMPCENYAIPHDRRGVLSMCHSGKHKKNSVQFFVTLAPASWMDSLYVAFGYYNYNRPIKSVIYIFFVQPVDTRRRSTTKNRKGTNLL